MPSLGERLMQARKAAKLSRPKLAVLVERDPHTVYMWEKKGQRPEEAALEKLATALQVTVQWLLFGEDSFVERDPHPVWLEFEETDTFKRLKKVIPEEMLWWEARAPWGRGGITVEDLERRAEELGRIYQRLARAEREVDEARDAREAREREGKPVAKLKPT